MISRGKYLIFILLAALIATSVIGLTLYSSSAAAEKLSSYNVKPTYPGEEYEISIFNGTITSINSGNITVESEDFRGELLAKGGWIYINSELTGLGNWSKVSNQVDKGDALIAMISIKRRDKDVNILIGLKQDDLILLRPIVLKRCTVKWLHTRNYFGVYGEISYKGENYMVLEKKGYKLMMIVGQDSKWYKTGYRVVTWSDVRDEFNEGDMVRVFCHNILILNNKLADYLGLKAVIWGYSGSIIDLNTGTTLMRYLG